MFSRSSGIVATLLLVCLNTVLAQAPPPVSFLPAVNYSAGTGPYSVAVGDFNGDSKVDLAVANRDSGNVSVLLGIGDGTFQAASNFDAGSLPRSVAVGDFNGDGKPDLAVANQHSNVSVFLGIGDGTFQAAPTFAAGASPFSVAVSDLDGDGKLDLTVANRGSDNVSVFLGIGDGTFQPAVNYSVDVQPISAMVGDFNGDGKADLAVANYNDGTVSVLLGNGDGTFQPAVNYGAGSYPQSVAVGDFNGDGKLDLAVANYGDNTVSVLLGKGDGTFQAAVNYGVDVMPASVTVGDFNGDGKPDLAVTNSDSASVSVLLGNGEGSFQAAVNYGAGNSPFSVAVGDFNGDGKPDLAVANFYDGTVSVLLNTTALSGIGITSPPKGSILTGSSVTFTWSQETGASSYQLWLGHTPGAHDITAVGTTGLSATVTNLPTDRSQIYATLYGYASGRWSVQDTATYTAATIVKAQIASPPKGATLNGSSVAFTWTAETSATSYQLWVGHSAGAHDIAVVGTSGLSATANGLPSDGSLVYVTLYGYAGSWSVQDTATYTAATVAKAQITSPPKNSTLPGASTTFTWTAESGATSYQLWVGHSTGTHDIAVVSTSGLSGTANGLPIDGSQVYATLYGYAGSWSVQDTATYTAANVVQAQITSPPKNSTLPGASTTFTWTAESGATSYQLWVGHSAGTHDIAVIGTSGLSGTANGLPIDGSLVYVTLYGYANGRWSVQDTATYTAAAIATIVSPPNGSTLSGSTVTFVWTRGTGPTSYQLWVGSTPGAQDIAMVETTHLSAMVGSLPTDGSQIYVTLYSLVGGQWFSNAYTYTSGPGPARGKVIMSLVLDRSGSMISDGGGTALHSAVPTFVDYFNETTDEVALVSFSSNATVDFHINYNFKTPINTMVAAMPFAGGTFGTGAGTQPILSDTVGAPLSLAQLQNDSVLVPPGEDVVKVVVYFTDGLMNTIQDNFYCKGRGGTGLTLINYGGYDTGSQVDFFDPTSATDWGHYTSGAGFPYTSGGAICRDINGNIVTTFPSQQSGTPVAFTRANVTIEAQYRAIQTALALRTEAPIPTYIYTIGLGSGVNQTTQAFLAQLANDPSYPTYISGQPAGEFFYIADCPSLACTDELNAAFQAIASKLLTAGQP